MRDIRIKTTALLLVLAMVATLITIQVTAADEADLTVTNVGTRYSEVYDGENLKLYAIVRNLSLSAVDDKFAVDFLVDGKVIQSVTYTEGISAGGKTTVETTFTNIVFFGSHKISARVNGSKRLTESNYDNNYINERLSVIDGENANPTASLPMEKKPVTLSKGTTVQAEKTNLAKGTTVQNSIKGYKGNGYVVVNKESDGFAFDFNAETAGTYTMKIRYSTVDTSPGGISYSKNTTGAYSPISFRKQEQSGSWDYETFNVVLSKPGTIPFKFFVSPGNKMNLMIDEITLEKSVTKLVDSFSFMKADNQSLTGDIKCSIDKDRITAYIPSDLDVTDLVATYSTKCTSVTVQGAEQKSGATHNDFTNGHYYTFTDEKGNSVRYAVKLVRLNDKGIPNLFIDFGSDVSKSDLNTIKNGWRDEDKSVVVDCKYSLNANGSVVLPNAKTTKLNDFSDVEGTIHLRGNSTLGSPKKSYKVKFKKKNAVLDMEKSKSWVLLACYGDKSLMRDYIGYQIGQTLSNTGYAPDMRYVNLFVDGKYNGLYLIGEGAKIGKGRLEMTEIDEKSTDITGGYIVEVDHRKDEAENVMFEVKTSNSVYPFSIKEPSEEVLTDEMREYIRSYIQEFIDVLREDPASREYEKYIDVDSFVDWYIAMEIAKVNDSSGYASIYMHKDAGGKLAMGPVWDFVPGSGSVNYNGALNADGTIREGKVADSKGYWIKNSLWWRYLFKDPVFVEKVKARWQELYANGFDGIIDKIDNTAAYIKNAADDNFAVWDTLSKYVWAEPFILYSREAYVKEYRDWMSARIEWLNTEYGK